MVGVCFGGVACDVSVMRCVVFVVLLLCGLWLIVDECTVGDDVYVCCVWCFVLFD